MYKIIIPVMGYSELFRITHYRNNNLIEKHRRTSGANNLFAPDVLRYLKNDFKMKFSHVSLFVDLSDYSDLNQLNVSRNLSSTLPHHCGLPPNHPIYLVGSLLLSRTGHGPSRQTRWPVFLIYGR